MISGKALEALKPPTYEKINELRIAAEKENAILKAELIKTKHEQSLFNERLEEELKVQAYEIYQQYEHDELVRENVEGALTLIESKLRNMNCLEIASDAKLKEEFKQLVSQRNLLIEILRTDEDEE